MKTGYARTVSGERALPVQASLRYLKVEAKRRHAAGEFPTPHLAQLAIAREHGQPSWTALKEAVDAAGAAAGREGHALAQLRWIAARFAGADEPGWLTPGEDELREHFTATFLTAVPPVRLIATIIEIAPALRAELTVTVDRPFLAQGRLAGHLVMAETEPRPPYRLTGVRARRLGERISDERAAAPATAASGTIPAGVPGLAEGVTGRLGLVGLARQLLPRRDQARRRRRDGQGTAHAHRRGDRPGGNQRTGGSAARGGDRPGLRLHRQARHLRP
jgi:hypothetical protein